LHHVVIILNKTNIKCHDFCNVSIFVSVDECCKCLKFMYSIVIVLYWQHDKQIQDFESMTTAERTVHDDVTVPLALSNVSVDTINIPFQICHGNVNNKSTRFNDVV